MKATQESISHTNAIEAELRAKILECGGGEGIPGWCEATGKCSCALYKKAADELERLTRNRRRTLQSNVESASPRAVAKFWSLVDKKGPDECWEWKGRFNKDGYGHTFMGGKADKRAHRVACALMGKVQPPGLEADHLCRNRWCVNPAHIQFVTHAENMNRSTAPHIMNRNKTVCKHGHDLTNPANVRNSLRNGSNCRSCKLCASIDVKANKAALALGLDPRPEWLEQKHKQMVP